MKFWLIALLMSVVSVSLFCWMGESPLNAAIWSALCVCYGRSTALIERVTGKLENPKSELYAGTYFGIAILFVLIIYFFVPSDYFTVSTAVFLVGLLIAQILAQSLFGLKATCDTGIK